MVDDPSPPSHGVSPVRVLAIDGGGVRGIIPALILDELERRSGRRCSEMFDLIAGTSTGALLAVGLSCPARGSDRPAGAGQLVGIYDHLAGKVFPQHRPLERALRRAHLATYDTEGLNRVLSEFVSGSISEAVVELLVMAFDLQSSRALTLTRSAAAADANRDFKAVDIACGACAAPTVFKPVKVRSRAGRGPSVTLVDAGVFVNNPTMVAVSAAVRRWPGLPLRVVSLGTGDVDVVASERAVASPSLNFWRKHILDIAGDGASQVVDEQAATLSEPGAYWRLQVGLPQDQSRLDDPAPTYLAALRGAAQSLITAKSRRLDEIIAALA